MKLNSKYRRAFSVAKVPWGPPLFSGRGEIFGHRVVRVTLAGARLLLSACRGKIYGIGPQTGLETIMKVILSITIMVLIAQSSSFAEPVLTFGRPHDPISEFSSQMLLKAYTRMGYALNFVDLPAERSLMKSNNGFLDGEVNRIKGIEKEYGNLIMVPVPVNFFEAVVFTKRHNFRVNGWASLTSFSIAIRIGSKFVEYRTSGMNVTKFSTYEKIFLLLYNDRYDICVSSRITGLEQIKKQNLIGIKALEPPLETINLYHYLHLKHKALIPKISNELQRMEQEGILPRERALFVSELFGNHL